MDWLTGTLLVFGLLLICLAGGIPVGFSMGLVGIVGMLLVAGPAGIGVLGKIAYDRFASYMLSPLPLFIFMGEVLLFSTVSVMAYDALMKWLGFVPVGLAVTAVGACAAFAAVCGSSAATTATIGVVAIPEMLKRNYSPRLACASVSAGGALGILIPPSTLMIIYAVVTETSVAQLFMGGVIPGFLLAGALMLYVLIRCAINPSLGPRGPSFSWRERIGVLPNLLPVVSLAVIVLGSMYFGIATPTEAAAVGAFGAIITAIAFKKLDWHKLMQAAIHAAVTSGFIITIFVGASILALLLSYLYIPQNLCKAIIGLGLPDMWVLIGIMLLYMVLGCVMDPGGILLLTAPVVVPLAINLGWDLVWVGILFTVNMEMANITPPVGYNLFVMKAIAPKEVKLSDIMMGVWPFVGIQAAVLGLVIAFPQLALWLPSRMTS